MTEKEFRETVLITADMRCENPHCDAEADSVHHFMKKSVFPNFRTLPDNGMAVCGSCHEQIENMQRENKAFESFYPTDRYIHMLGLAGYESWLIITIKQRKVNDLFIELYGIDQRGRFVSITSRGGMIELIIEGKRVLDTVGDYRMKERSLIETLRQYCVELDFGEIDS